MGRPKGSTQHHRDRIARLSSEEFADQSRFTPEQIAMLDKIANGAPPRNALSVLRGMELKASYAYSKPKQSVEVIGKLTLEQIMLEALKPEPAGGEGTS